MDAALLYHYWNESHAEAWKDLRVPVVLSIVTFRRWDQTTPIYVVDVSHTEKRWGDYPDFLNFKVVKTDYHLRRLTDRVDSGPWRFCPIQMFSKPKDIYNFSLTIPYQTILCVDADYFFLQTTRPIQHSEEEPPVIGHNTGYWKYNKKCPLTARVFDIWKAACANVLLDDVFRDKVMRKTGRAYLNDETVMNFLQKEHQGITKHPSLYDNVTFNSLVAHNIDVTKIRGPHVISASFRIIRGSRGLACVWIKELRETVEAVLSPKMMTDIFGEQEYPCFSLADRDKLEWLNHGKML